MIGRLRGLVAEVGEEDALIDVAGVGYVVRCGARTLSRLPAVGEEAPPAELQDAAQRGDQAAVSRANGVGPKLALRIVTELKDKPIADGPVAAFHAGARPIEPAKPTATGEAVAALMGLGVAEPAARRVVEQAALRLGEDTEAPALIKAALQELGR
jgi:holliday junction DNA helicase RuvA